VRYRRKKFTFAILSPDEFLSILLGDWEVKGDGMFFSPASVNNFLAPIQVRLSPNFVSHTLGHRGQGN